jgi:hypothetical protein
MLSAHDMEKKAKERGVTLIIMRIQSDQMSSWALLKWYVDFFPKMIKMAEQQIPGSTLIVYRDGRFNSP